MRWIEQTGEWSDCRLVVAANAALMLGLDPPRPVRDRAMWRALVEAALAAHGAALAPERSDRAMGLVAISYQQPWIPADLLPGTGLAIRDPKAGFHCVLVSDRDTRGLSLVGYKWEPRPRRFTFAQVERLLYPNGNSNRLAELFVPREQTVGSLHELALRVGT